MQTSSNVSFTKTLRCQGLDFDCWINWNDRYLYIKCQNLSLVFSSIYRWWMKHARIFALVSFLCAISLNELCGFPVNPITKIKTWQWSESCDWWHHNHSVSTVSIPSFVSLWISWKILSLFPKYSRKWNVVKESCYIISGGVFSFLIIMKSAQIFSCFIEFDEIEAVKSFVSVSPFWLSFKCSDLQHHKIIKFDVFSWILMCCRELMA